MLNSSSLTWRSVATWVLATALGWVLFTLPISIVAKWAIEESRLYRWEAAPIMIIVGILCGAIAGGLVGWGQWVAQRCATRRWILATSLGWCISGVIYWNAWYDLWYIWQSYSSKSTYAGAYQRGILPIVVISLASGLLAVSGQCILWRQRIAYVIWWGLATAMGWSTALYISWSIYETIFLLTESVLVQTAVLLLGGGILGVITGITFKLQHGFDKGRHADVHL